jgi:predicted dehydrogenase
LSEVATEDLAVPEQELRAVLIGAGGFGQIWWELHHSISGVRIVALVDREQDAMTSAGTSLAVPAAQQFIRLEDALASGPIDIVIDSTPPDYHAQNALLAMQNGAHVFMAKPAASRWDDAVTMAREADRAGVILAVNEQFRFGWLPLALATRSKWGRLGASSRSRSPFESPLRGRAGERV